MWKRSDISRNININVNNNNAICFNLCTSCPFIGFVQADMDRNKLLFKFTAPGAVQQWQNLGLKTKPELYPLPRVHVH